MRRQMVTTMYYNYNNIFLVDYVNTLLVLTVKLETSYTVNNKKMILKPTKNSYFC